MLTLPTGPPFLPLEEAACIGRGSGMRSNSVLTSVIFMLIFSPLKVCISPVISETGVPFAPEPH
jgi:hypothetical protein